MLDKYSEFIGTYDDDILFLELARKALLNHPSKRAIPEWCDASTARLYAVTMVGSLEHWLAYLQENGSLGVLDVWFNPKTQNGARVRNLFKAFRVAGIGVNKDIFKDFLAIKYLRNTIVHAKWKPYEASWVKRRGFPDNASRLTRKHLRRMMEVYRTMLCYTIADRSSRSRHSEVQPLGTIHIKDEDM